MSTFCMPSEHAAQECARMSDRGRWTDPEIMGSLGRR